MRFGCTNLQSNTSTHSQRNCLESRNSLKRKMHHSAGMWVCAEWAIYNVEHLRRTQLQCRGCRLDHPHFVGLRAAVRWACRRLRFQNFALCHAVIGCSTSLGQRSGYHVIPACVHDPGTALFLNSSTHRSIDRPTLSSNGNHKPSTPATSPSGPGTTPPCQ
jgi:hypothetical protein